MKKVNCLIADDEEIARGILESYVHQLDQLNLIGLCSNGAEVFNLLKSNEVDLIFLDIQMPVLSGLELLRTLKKTPRIILTTAYREFALEGYELNVIDYLLKPISFERFLKAIEKYEDFLHPESKASGIGAFGGDQQGQEFLYVKSDKKMVRVMLKDIRYIEGLKDYVKIYLADKTIITYRTLTYFEETLSAEYFLRVHRSYIISLHHITAYSASTIEIGEVTIPIGNSYGKDVFKRLEL
jgi:DNA-binding LytR/AlgR family response regulator